MEDAERGHTMYSQIQEPSDFRRLERVWMIVEHATGLLEDEQGKEKPARCTGGT